MNESKAKVQDLLEVNFEILKEGDLSKIRAGGAPVTGKPATKAGSAGYLPEACDNAS